MSDDDKLSFLDRPRDENGRFAPTKAEPAPLELPQLEAEKAPPQQEPAPQAQQAPVAPAAPPQTPTRDAPPPGYIPLEALLETREKAQRAAREAEEYRRKYEEATRKPAQPIDPIADPEGFERQRAREREDDRFENSWLIAQSQFGEETVSAAEEWLKGELERNPGLFHTIRQERHPYASLVKLHKRALAVAKLGDDDPDSWFEKQAKERGYIKPDQQQQPALEAVPPTPQPRAPLPRPSLANAPSAGGSAPKIPVGDGVAFGAVFKS